MNRIPNLIAFRTTQTGRETRRRDIVRNITRNADRMINRGRRRRAPLRLRREHRVLVRNFTRAGKMVGTRKRDCGVVNKESKGITRREGEPSWREAVQVAQRIVNGL